MPVVLITFGLIVHRVTRGKGHDDELLFALALNGTVEKVVSK